MLDWVTNEFSFAFPCTMNDQHTRVYEQTATEASNKKDKTLKAIKGIMSLKHYVYRTYSITYVHTHYTSAGA